ncbi:hypothetical protein BLNAU_21721 [Blattamonas nauphoetae]|uniref:IRS-type PTB domain-containing protein n=1 Tax=Blattamonas nauphoetae TaxID=2049346 RepID=A0ABQ9WV37_9EUKA|nr:hypothetical protein BLNAU_21721 [Blattamonas nauphoetae]
MSLEELYFSDQDPVGKFAVNEDDILILTLSSVSFLDKAGKQTTWPLKDISSWGNSSTEFRLMIIDRTANGEKVPRTFQTKEGFLILEFLKHIVDVVLQKKGKTPSFFRGDSTSTQTVADNPLHVKDFVLDLDL